MAAGASPVPMHSMASPYREKASDGDFCTNSSSTCLRLFFWSVMMATVVYGWNARFQNGGKRGRMKREKNRTINLEHNLKLKPKPVSASRSEMTEIVLPAQTNPLGKLLGGQVMHLVDMVAAVAAHRHSNSYVVTASVDYIDFRNPINLGEIVNLKSQVNRVFRTSMEVGVEVYSENAMTGFRKQNTAAYVTLASVDEQMR